MRSPLTHLEGVGLIKEIEVACQPHVEMPALAVVILIFIRSQEMKSYCLIVLRAKGNERFLIDWKLKSRPAGGVRWVQ